MLRLYVYIPSMSRIDGFKYAKLWKKNMTNTVIIHQFF